MLFQTRSFQVFLDMFLISAFPFVSLHGLYDFMLDIKYTASLTIISK